jgi:hypothetical protein
MTLPQSSVIMKKFMNPINPMKKLITTKLMPLLLGMISFQSMVATPAAQALDSLPSGTYACWTNVSSPGYIVPPLAGPYGDFILDGNGRYTNRSSKTSGRYEYQGSTVTLLSGKFDGYSAEVKETKNYISLKFRRNQAGKFVTQSCSYRKN